jgi:hypothetical protein
MIMNHQLRVRFFLVTGLILNEDLMHNIKLTEFTESNHQYTRRSNEYE